MRHSFGFFSNDQLKAIIPEAVQRGDPSNQLLAALAQMLLDERGSNVEVTPRLAFDESLRQADHLLETGELDQRSYALGRAGILDKLAQLNASEGTIQADAPTEAPAEAKNTTIEHPVCPGCGERHPPASALFEQMLKDLTEEFGEENVQVIGNQDELDALLATKH